METILQILLVIISIMGVGLFGGLWYFFTTLQSKIDKSEQTLQSKIDKSEQNQTQRFNDFKEHQTKIQEVQNQKFDFMIKGLEKVTEQLSNHITDLQRKQDKIQEKQDKIEKDISEIKHLLKRNNKSS